MKFFLIAVICAILVASNANVYDGFFKDSEHPGKCVYEGMVLAANEEKQAKGICERFVCLRDDGWGRVLGCDIQVVEPPCELGERMKPDAEFPYCCVRHTICN